MSGPPDISGMTSLKVDNLTYRTTSEDVRDMFAPYGKLGDVYIPRDNYTKESRGFAFVRFYEERDAEDAIRALDGRDVQGRQLRVSLACRPRPEFSNRGGGGDRHGGGGGYDRGGDRRGGGRDRYDDRYDDRDRHDDRDRYDDRRRSPPRRDRDDRRDDDRGRDRDRDERSRYDRRSRSRS
mmetsp:Transcript_46970/g.89676  ORF Transcript_46970/g.89676 Transcript_46970/m.89676 type:complete len:181 (-) Transcript_46970:270-812(-)